MVRVKYFVSAPNSVKKVAEEFRKKIKKKKKKHNYLRRLKNVDTIKECNFALVFCPIVSRTGTDIEAKLSEIERDFEDKPVILIVLHHTFDNESIVSDSRKFVSKDNVHGTLDVLFHEDKGLLKCESNSEALKQALNYIKSEIKNPQDTTNERTNKKSKK